MVTGVFAIPLLIGTAPSDDVSGGDPAPSDTVNTSSTFLGPTMAVPDVPSASAIAAQLGASPISDEELWRITRAESHVSNGYLIDSVTTDSGAYELGLVVFDENLPFEYPLTCFAPYALTQGQMVAGAFTCASESDVVSWLASLHLSVDGTCGGLPKEDPVVEGVWTLLTVWGLPETVATVTAHLDDGSTIEIPTHNRVAHWLWESSVGIEALEFDGMSDEQRAIIASYLPAPGVDCAS